MPEADHSEQWKPIKDYESFYSVSNQGRIRRDAPAEGTRPGLILVGSFTHGYRVVVLCGGNKRITRAVHRMVAVAFLGHPPRGKQVNHKNGDKTDNRLCNLEYVTASENVIHAIKYLNRGSAKGERNGMSKLSASDVAEIRNMYASGLRTKEIADKYSVHEGTVSAITRRKTWRHVK